jgi:predicted nicotinamide N-methyase
LNSLFPYTLSRQKVLDLDLLVPDPDKVRMLYEEGRAAELLEPFPFWTRIWPSAMALSSFIECHPKYVEGKKILELGAGLALPSFIASRYAGSVLATDYIEDAVWLMKQNIEALKLQNINAELMDWHKLPENVKADTVLLSDINYSPDAFDALHNVIEQFLRNGSIIILTTPGRLVSNAFIDFLMPYIAYRELTDIDGTEILLVVLIKKQGEHGN